MAITPQQLIDRVVALDKDLASFYAELQLHLLLAPLNQICRYMAQHAGIHAELIANCGGNAEIPRLAISPIETLHDRLKARLRHSLAAGDDIVEAARKLSQAEEIISQAYTRIADQFTHLSEAYRMIAGKFKSLADGECGHRDMILREMERLQPVPASSAPEGET